MATFKLALQPIKEDDKQIFKLLSNNWNHWFNDSYFGLGY